MTSEHADTLNALSDMQGSVVYALRRNVLVNAERLIVAQEKRIKELAARVERLNELAEAVKGCLLADCCPIPPVATYPLDEFAELYRAWYHGSRFAALAALARVEGGE